MIEVKIHLQDHLDNFSWHLRAPDRVDLELLPHPNK